MLIQAVKYLAATGISLTLLPVSEYLGDLLNLLCQWWLTAECVAAQRDDLILELIRSGANIHRIDRMERSPLQNLIWNSFGGDPASMTTTWLDLLNYARIDVIVYLQEELRICPSTFELNAHNRNLQVDFVRAREVEWFVSQHGSISFEMARWVDPASPVHLLFQEFDFCPDIVITRAIFCSKIKPLLDLWQSDHPTRLVDEGRKSISELLVEWNQGQGKQPESESDSDEVLDYGWMEVPDYLDLTSKQMRDMARHILEFPGQLCRCDAYGNYIDLWPFYGGTHTLCSSGNRLTDGCLGRSRSNRWCKMHSYSFNHTRFARKEQKKALKRRRILGKKPAKTVMPGSWVV